MRLLLCLLILLPAAALAQSVDAIPKPAQVEIKSGFFNFSKGLGVKMNEADNESTFIMQYFAHALFKNKRFAVPVSKNDRNIVLKLLPAKADSATDASYHIRVSPDSVLIEAHTHRGLHYGCQTAVQLFVNSVLTYQLPAMEINDSPNYAWRGLEIDVCRHFFSKEVIKQYIDLLSSLKMNVFHWHLTDDQGWRIEIKKYPKLTEAGAWRTEKDGTKYGGYYAQDDIREVVNYANERYVTIVPEIELPGHSSAAISAYPELSCTPDEPKTVPNRWGIFRDIYCPSDFTFQFIRDVLDEVCELFPGKYIHLGGDEAPKTAWKKSEVAQALIKKEGLKNEEELQHYVLKKMEDYLATKNKTAIGWGEIVRGGLSDSVIVMSWMDKGAGVKAVKQGNRVIMTPRFFCYFDYPEKISDKKGAWYMTYLPVRKVYQFNPAPKTLPVEKQALILGGQANVWTEKISTEQQLYHQTMPRLVAMAEALWSNPLKKDYADFKRRLKGSGVFGK
ncbi:MAG TPA: beta-N-acetylhexosaminidase [Chitinophagales bacterium]|nr:beta-N-acetylhexosaminidase [Chitinophagales bacterium]